jgi:drug/metabolite transporter (DMT)-like permease
MVSAVFVFAIMDSLLKRLSPHYSPFQIASLRCFSSLTILLLPVIWHRSWAKLKPRSPHLHLLRAALGIGMLITFIYAVRRLSMAETYSITLCAPLLMTALSGPFLGEKVPLRRWVAILVGMGGVLVILQPGQGGFVSKLAVLAAGASAVCYALSALSVRALSRTNTNTSMVFWWMVLVGCLSLAVALPDWRPIPVEDWKWLAGVGISGALGQVWITDAFRRAPPSVVGPFEYTALLWGFAIDWIFWSASPSRSLLIGAAIIILSGIYIVWDERRLADLAYSPATPPP